jgi:Sec-independent protein translocase protein TatA
MFALHLLKLFVEICHTYCGSHVSAPLQLQDWTMGVLALKLWHLLVMVAPRRDGAAPPDSWQAHFDALQAGGLRNLDFSRALSKIVLPVLLNLATSLAVPYVVTRAVLPLLQLPASVLGYANLYAYQVYHGVYVAWLGGRRLHALAVQLHNAIRDDRYLVGRQLNNFELRQQQQQQREQKEREQQEQRQRQLAAEQQKDQAVDSEVEGSDRQQQCRTEAGAATAASSSSSSASSVVAHALA